MPAPLIVNIQFSIIIIFSLSQVYGNILHLSFIQGGQHLHQGLYSGISHCCPVYLRFIHISIHYWSDYIFPISIRRYRVSTKMFMQFFWICTIWPASKSTASHVLFPVFDTSEYISDTSLEISLTSPFSSSLVIFIDGSPSDYVIFI